MALKLSNINLVEDVGAPVLVAAVDIGVSKYKPTWHDYAIYGLTAVGYLGAVMNMGGQTVKNIGIASAPLTLRKLYNKFATPAPVTASAGVSYHKVSRYPADNVNPVFQGTRLV